MYGSNAYSAFQERNLEQLRKLKEHPEVPADLVDTREQNAGAPAGDEPPGELVRVDDGCD